MWAKGDCTPHIAACRCTITVGRSRKWPQAMDYTERRRWRDVDKHPQEETWEIYSDVYLSTSNLSEFRVDCRRDERNRNVSGSGSGEKLE